MEMRQTRLLHCHASGREGAWEAVCLDFDVAVQGRNFDDVSSLLQEAIALYLQTVNDMPEAERSAFLERAVPLGTRLGFAIEAIKSALRTRGDGELRHDFMMAMPPPA